MFGFERKKYFNSQKYYSGKTIFPMNLIKLDGVVLLIEITHPYESHKKLDGVILLTDITNPYGFYKKLDGVIFVDRNNQPLRIL